MRSAGWAAKGARSGNRKRREFNLKVAAQETPGDLPLPFGNPAG
jgi:hypothetical protein